MLLGNVLENAIRAAQELRNEDPDCAEGVRFIADEDRNLLRVRVDNACARVRFADPDRTEGFLPARRSSAPPPAARAWAESTPFASAMAAPPRTATTPRPAASPPGSR